MTQTFQTPVLRTQIVVAGHLCLDIIPTFASDFNAAGQGLETLLAPGKLVTVGPVVLSTGGAVSNTGLALHRLGVPTRLMGKVGDDLFGRAILDFINRRSPALTTDMIVDATATSSYTMVINPPGVDRIFFHCPGANDTFSANDVDPAALRAAAIFHFGYPPIMQRMFMDDGIELVTLMQRAKATGAITSLDMSYPDATAPAGQVDWRQILAATLPHVDIFLPSLEELLFALDRPRHDALSARGSILSQTGGALLDELAQEVLAMGVAVAGIKLGKEGFYLRTSDDPARLAVLASLPDPPPVARWIDRQLLAPSFAVNVMGTTGAGDCAIAGFLAGLSCGSGPARTLVTATAAGAFNVESADATSGIPAWSTVLERAHSDHPRRAVDVPLPGWRWDATTMLWHGPADNSYRADRSDG